MLLRPKNRLSSILREKEAKLTLADHTTSQQCIATVAKQHLQLFSRYLALKHIGVTSLTFHAYMTSSVT